MATIERLKKDCIIDENGCWLWAGCLDQDGYGMVWHKGRSRRVHCVSYELNVGPIPDGRLLDHTCHSIDNCDGGISCHHRRCFNPLHLEPVTHTENTQRGHHRFEKGQAACAAHQRNKTHCPQGHTYDVTNTGIDHRGHRKCIECNRIGARLRARRKAAIKRARMAANVI